MKCHHCGKPIKKATVTVYIKREPSQYDHPTPSIRYVYVGDSPPRAADDLVPYASGQKVVAVKYGKSAIHSFHTWDGIHYRPVFGFFCTNRCASEFGQRCAARGLS